MRKILFEIPNAQAVAWVVAAMAVVYAIWHALRKPRKDDKGEREPFPAGQVVGGLVVAAVLVLGVARNDAFLTDLVRLKSGRTFEGRIKADDSKHVEILTAEGVRQFRASDVEKTETGKPAGIPIYSYGFMMMVAFATAIYVATVRTRNAGMDPNLILDLGLWCMVSGIAGARLFHVIQFSDQFAGRPFLDYFKVWEGGLVFYGGMIGSTVACLLFLVYKKAPVRKTFDLVAPSLPLGVAFARIGCFLNGCCFGAPVESSFPFGVKYGEGSHALSRHLHLHHVPPGATESLPVHPTQLYSSIACFTIFVLVSLYFAATRKRRVDGEVFLLFVTLYPISRWIMESMREDTDRIAGTGMTISQNISVLMLSVTLPLFLYAMWVKYRKMASAAQPVDEAK